MKRIAVVVSAVIATATLVVLAVGLTVAQGHPTPASASSGVPACPGKAVLVKSGTVEVCRANHTVEWANKAAYKPLPSGVAHAAYTGPGGCPLPSGGLPPDWTTVCAYHTNIRRFIASANTRHWGAIFDYRGYCSPGPCTSDTGSLAHDVNAAPSVHNTSTCCNMTSIGTYDYQFAPFAIFALLGVGVIPGMRFSEIRRRLRAPLRTR